MPQSASLRNATSLSISLGTALSIFPFSLTIVFSLSTRYLALRAWIAKDMSMISAGCPSPAARFTRRPSAMIYTVLPFSSLYASMLFLAGAWLTAISFNAATATSTSKCPALQQIAPSFIFRKCSAVMTSLHPVTVTKMSPSAAATDIDITLNPSITASIARIGSISVTMTSAPRPFALIATPLPHHP